MKLRDEIESDAFHFVPNDKLEKVMHLGFETVDFVGLEVLLHKEGMLP